MESRAYRPYEPLFDRPSRLLSPEEARREFDHVVAGMDSRLAELARVVGPFGLTLDLKPSSLTPLESWFLGSVQRDPARVDKLDAVWYALAHDMGLYVGETLIRASSAYRWMLSEDPASEYFQRCVIGMLKSDGSVWEWDPGQTLGDLGHQEISGRHLRSSFIGPMVAELIEYGNSQS